MQLSGKTVFRQHTAYTPQLEFDGISRAVQLPGSVLPPRRPYTYRGTGRSNPDLDRQFYADMQPRRRGR